MGLIFWSYFLEDVCGEDFKMIFFENLLVGILQGATEFLPVSSSGHLQLVRIFLEETPTEEALFLDIFMHSATMLATIVVFRHKLVDFFKLFLSWCFLKKNDSKFFNLKKKEKTLLTKYIFFLIIATLPGE